jgi:hypothetical protein
MTKRNSQSAKVATNFADKRRLLRTKVTDFTVREETEDGKSIESGTKNACLLKHTYDRITDKIGVHLSDHSLLAQ